MTDLQDEAVEVLQRLLRFNTVNPPGNERALMEWLAGYLREAGLEVEFHGRTEERPNLIARLRGEVDGPVMGLLSHVDTVLAHPEEWERDPWSGDLNDGFVWGRGALDMKSQTAAEAVAVATLARSGWRPARGELKLIALVDEETGGAEGAGWLCTHRPEEARCDVILNEGGGNVFDYGGTRRYGVCVAEKGVFRFTVVTDGVAAHASIPRLGDNALLKMAPVLEAFAERTPSYRLTEAPRALLAGLGEEVSGDDPTAAIARIREAAPELAVLFEPMLGVTMTPTRISASEKVNVIPSSARLKVDCRVPPGLGEEAALEAAREVLGDNGYRLEFDERTAGNASPVSTDLMDHIAAWISEQDPGAGVVPTVLPGFTDSRHFRGAFPDCVAYGFFPQREQPLLEAAPLIHGANERIHAGDLGWAATFFRDIVRRVLG